MTSSRASPDERVARQIAVQTFGLQPTRVSRFPTGLMHYVYEATFETHTPVVIRIAAIHGHEAMRNAAQLSRILRPRRVPLPAILAEDLKPPFPYLVLERLFGSDLGEIIDNLSRESLEAIARAVVDAQRATAELQSSTKRYGYAVASENAPYSNWSQVLAAHLDRSQKRIAAAGLFNVCETDALSVILRDMDKEIGAVTATPFLHDTTTKNVIVSPDGRFSGIVDVDDLCFGDPRYVVALTRATLLARGTAVDYTDAWMRSAGFSTDRLFQLYVVLFLADFMAERGQRFNGNEYATNPESDQHLHRLYFDALSQL